MLYRIEIGAQIQVDDIGLVSQNRLRHALDRSRRRPLWPIAKRSRLEVRLEDRFQDQLQCSLDHSVTDRRNRQTACSAIRLRYSYGPYPQGRVCALLHTLASLVEKILHTFGFDGFERYSVNTWSAVVHLRQPIGFPKSLSLTYMHIQTPKAPRRFSLRLDV